MGIISTSFWGCKAELESGELVQLLTDSEIGTVEVNALLAGGKSAKPSARAFVDYLVASFRDSASITSSLKRYCAVVNL